MNTCLPSDFIFTSAFGEIDQQLGWLRWLNGLDGCPSGNTPVTGTMSFLCQCLLDKKTFSLGLVRCRQYWRRIPSLLNYHRLIHPLQQTLVPGISFQSEVVTLIGFVGTTVALNFNSVVPDCYTGPGNSLANVAMNGTCLPSDAIFVSRLKDRSYNWDGCGGLIGLDGCPSSNTPVAAQCQFR